MLSLMPLITLLLGAGYVISVVHMLSATEDAPIGYEDEDGFHYGLAPVRIDRS